MTTTARHVTDTNGVRYALGREVGRGGQGAVFEVEGGKLAAKLVFDASPSRRERLRNQLTQVKRLPLEGIDLAKPLEMLRSPQLGYVMELLTGMVSLKALAFVPKGATLVTKWYFATGGLRRRLQLLARTADVLSQLHGKGLVYSDPSPHNILVSEGSDGTEVRLIDADNLHYVSSPGSPSVFTPGYGAPELVRGASGVTSLTDAHAFSVLAFHTLALTHPLIGDAIAQGEPEREQESLAGQVPWIDHPSDDSNRSTVGIPRDVVLSDRLAELCQRAFGEALQHPTKRPGVAEWAERLHAAADATITCPSVECGGTYYFKKAACPWCDEPRPTFVTATFQLWDPSMGPGSELLQKPARDKRKPVIVAVAALTERDPVTLTGRLLEGRDGARGAQPRIELRFVERRLSIRSLDGRPYLLTSPTGGRTAQVGEQAVDVRLESGVASWRLHLGNPDQFHRVLSFELRKGVGG